MGTCQTSKAVNPEILVKQKTIEEELPNTASFNIIMTPKKNRKHNENKHKIQSTSNIAHKIVINESNKNMNSPLTFTQTPRNITRSRTASYSSPSTTTRKQRHLSFQNNRQSVAQLSIKLQQRNGTACLNSTNKCINATEVFANALQHLHYIIKEQANTNKCQQKELLALTMYLSRPRKMIATSREHVLKAEAKQKLNGLREQDSKVSSWIQNVMNIHINNNHSSNKKEIHMKSIAIIPKTQNKKEDEHKQTLWKLMTNISEIQANTHLKEMYKLLEYNKDIKLCLLSIHEWNFNAFQLSTYTSKPLTILSLYAMNIFDLFNKFHIKQTTFISFIENIEKKYKNHPYHNSKHAADVLAAQLYWLTSGDRKSKFQEILEPVDILVCIIGAVIHDVAHPGQTSAFEVRTQSKLALVYNDTSVLENYHLSVTFNILKKAKYDIFGEFNDEERKEIRRSLIDMVLTTDISKHVEHIAHMNEYIEQLQNDIHQSIGEHTSTVMSNTEVRNLLRNMSLKVSDLSNPTRPLDIALQWTKAITKEFMAQGDKERSLGLSVTPTMDRNNPNIELSQLAFIDHIIIPVYETWFKIEPRKTLLPISNILMVREYWIERVEQRTNLQQNVLRKKNQELEILLNTYEMKMNEM